MSLVSCLYAQEERKNFVSALAGMAILSGDAQTDFSAIPRASSYAARNGTSLNLAAGRHFNNWVSVQGNYLWNRNQVTLNGSSGNAFYSATNASSQHKIVVDGMLYFRPITSRVRPYLSTGVGPVRISRTQTALSTSNPAPALPTASASVWRPGLRVAVGVDLLLPSGWGFRYSFSETLTKNLFSESLLPPAPNNLMNFHHLWGLVKYF
jgi:outer membrane protein W